MAMAKRHQVLQWNVVGRGPGLEILALLLPGAAALFGCLVFQDVLVGLTLGLQGLVLGEDFGFLVGSQLAIGDGLLEPGFVLVFMLLSHIGLVFGEDLLHLGAVEVKFIDQSVHQASGAGAGAGCASGLSGGDGQGSGQSGADGR